MELFNVGTSFTAFIRPNEGANVGMIHTSQGTVLIDTASSPSEIRLLLEAANLQPADIRLVINTHFHTDHTWGNQLFTCPILAHRLCREKMLSNLKAEWSREALQHELAGLMRSDPQKAAQFHQIISELRVKVPDQVFENVFEGALGELQYRVIHMGGHTPDSAIVWLPEYNTLYAADLIFQGRYPYVFDADIPAWIAVLDRLAEFPAEVIIPGHGIRCSTSDITGLRDYLQRTWQLTQAHKHKGHSLEQTIADPGYPIYAPGKKEKLHVANIRYMYEKLSM